MSTPPVLLRLPNAAKAVGVSERTLLRAIAQSDPGQYPPPLRAKRLGTARNAPHVIEHAELIRWAASLPDA